jgi:hypothetical protein
MGTRSEVTTASTYEAEPAQRRLLGTVNVSISTWWSAELIMPDGTIGRHSWN